MTQQHLRRPGLRAAGAAAVIALAAAGCGASGAHPRSDVISITTGACGGQWHLARPGWHTFTIRNSAGAGAEVNLVSPATGAIYGEIEGLGPNTSRAMPVNVGSGASSRP